MRPPRKAAEAFRQGFPFDSSPARRTQQGSSRPMRQASLCCFIQLRHNAGSTSESIVSEGSEICENVELCHHLPQLHAAVPDRVGLEPGEQERRAVVGNLPVEEILSLEQDDCLASRVPARRTCQRGSAGRYLSRSSIAGAELRRALSASSERISVPKPTA